MKHVLCSFSFLLLACITGYSNDKDSTDKNTVSQKEIDELANLFMRLDSIEKTIEYQHGLVNLENGNAKLDIPHGFKFINAKQSQFILEDLWQNLPDASVLGMIVSDSFRVNGIFNSWVFVVTYDGMGYVKDDDADDINYDDLLKDLQEGQKQANIERTKLGYGELNITGWASTPFYDKKNKVLHWAKELNVAGNEDNTLNYDVRVLGRKGVLSLNAISGIDQLEEVKKNIPAILKMASFDQGHTYSEFNPDVDEVAAWTIGGLVAGKILVKAGLLAGLLKFWKLIAIGIIAGGSFIWKFVRGKKKQEQYAVETIADGSENSSTVS
ncbi:MAG: DUF2167 domain-containing protein [Chitinophagaceae bacterium]|nr:DUF2167 domain-containing protein [Chitinophagaceae bacterium]